MGPFSDVQVRKGMSGLFSRTDALIVPKHVREVPEAVLKRGKKPG